MGSQESIYFPTDILYHAVASLAWVHGFDGTHKFLEEGSRTHKFRRSYVLSFVHDAISMGSVGSTEPIHFFGTHKLKFLTTPLTVIRSVGIF